MGGDGGGYVLICFGEKLGGLRRKDVGWLVGVKRMEKRGMHGMRMRIIRNAFTGLVLGS